MLLEIGKFCERVEDDLNGLIDELSRKTNRNSPYELQAWRFSLPQLSIVLSQPRLEKFHIQLGNSSKSLSLEYKLPASSAWCDAVLLGMGENYPTAMMIELKDWDLRGDRPAERESLIIHHGNQVSHPSDQVRGYVEYCRHFHSTVLETNATVSGCVFFTSAKEAEIYRREPYSELISHYPIFCKGEYQYFSDYISNKLVQPDEEFAEKFENGLYAQDRNLVRQLSKLILENDQSVFVLIDEQRRGYELCLDAIDELLEKKDQQEKAVIIINGPPGSGKSVLAAKLWGALANDLRIQGNVVLTSTSSAQRSNWEAAFERVLKRRGSRAKGFIVKANKYNPGLSSKWLREMRDRGYELSVANWKKNLDVYFENGGKNNMPDNHIWASIVDEAHALIDPSIEGKEGVPSSGWFMQAGPQAYHIIRASTVSIFLLDSDQSYRDNETTNPERIKELAQGLGVKDTNIREISLGDAQFRCGGSKEYITWLENMLDLGDQQEVDVSWRRTDDKPNAPFIFEIVKDPLELDEILSTHIDKGSSARLAASYARKWVTKDKYHPHDLPPDEKDFCIEFSRDDKEIVWDRVWNYVPDSNYDMFVQAPAGSKMHEDPLSEVGCPYVVRGFDFDYLGILWLSDLVWRNNKWTVIPENIYESAWKNVTLPRARREIRNGEIGSYTEELITLIKRGYRILLSRALAGVYIWFEDEETREHVQSRLADKKII